MDRANGSENESGKNGFRLIFPASLSLPAWILACFRLIRLATFSTMTFWSPSSGVRAAAFLAGAKLFMTFWIFPDFLCFFKVLKSGDSEPGTPLERSGSKFCAKSRARELRSIYGDPFGEDFVPIRGHKGSGPGSHTFVCGRHTVSLCGRHTGQMCGRAVVREQLQPH